MINLIACAPSHVSSSTSISPRKSNGSQDPLLNCKEKKRSGRFDIALTDWKLLFTFTMNNSCQVFSSKLLLKKWRPCLVFSRVENWFWYIRAIGATRWNFLEHDTKSSTWFLSWRNSARRNREIRRERGNTSWQIGATWSSKRNKATTIIIGNDETELKLSLESK